MVCPKFLACRIRGEADRRGTEATVLGPKGRKARSRGQGRTRPQPPEQPPVDRRPSGAAGTLGRRLPTPPAAPLGRLVIEPRIRGLRFACSRLSAKRSFGAERPTGTRCASAVNGLRITGLGRAMKTCRSNAHHLPTSDLRYSGLLVLLFCGPLAIGRLASSGSWRRCDERPSAKRTQGASRRRRYSPATPPAAAVRGGGGRGGDVFLQNEPGPRVVPCRHEDCAPP